MKHTLLVASLFWIIGGAGCGGELDPFTLLNKPRVLALRSEPPVLMTDESAALSALLYNPEDEAISYQWSWCPATLGSLTAFECLFTEEEFLALLSQLTGGGAAPVPAFEFSTDAEPTFDPMSMHLACAAIEASGGASGEEGIVPLDCTEGLPLLIRLDVTVGDKTLSAVRRLRLIGDEAGLDNENPAVSGLLAAVEPDKGDATLSQADPVSSTEFTRLAENTRYRLFADIDVDQAETFLPAPSIVDPAPVERREGLILTWFVSGGSTTFARTSFNEVGNDFATLSTNIWETPEGFEIKDSGTDQVEVILVIRDERDGIGWAQWTVRVQGENP